MNSLKPHNYKSNTYPSVPNTSV